MKRATMTVKLVAMLCMLVIRDAQGATHGACASNPCLNSGSCYVLREAFLCECKPGFVGKRCEITVKLCAKCSTAAQGGAVCGTGAITGNPPMAGCTVGCYTTFVSTGKVVRGCIEDIPSVIKPGRYRYKSLIKPNVLDASGSVCTPSPTGQETCMCLKSACNKVSFADLGGGFRKTDITTTCKCPACRTGKPYKCYHDGAPFNSFWPACRCSDCSCNYGY